MPKPGGIVSVGRKAIEPKPADRTIAAIAERNGCAYSEELHAATDPSSSSAFRLAHKRRLEALRRLGVVERNADESWTVPRNFEERALQADARKQGLAVDVPSWLPIEALVERHAETWLDRMDTEVLEGAAGPFADELRTSLSIRKDWLRSNGYSLDYNGQLTREDAERLRRHELTKAAIAERARVELPFAYPDNWDQFSGTYSRHVDLAQGRFAVIEGKDGFVLVPASGQKLNWVGRWVELNRSRASIQWSLGRSRIRES